MQPTSFPFGKELRPFRYPQVETPFIKQKQNYDMPIGQWRYKAYFWRKVFFINMIISFFLVLIFIMLISVQQFIITVVSVTEEGNVRSVANLDLNHKYSVNLYRDFISDGIDSMLKASQSKEVSIPSMERLNFFWLDKATRHMQDLIDQNANKNMKLKNCSFYGNDRLACQLEIVDSKDKNTVWLMIKWKQTVPENEHMIELNPAGIVISDLVVNPVEKKSK